MVSTMALDDENVYNRFNGLNYIPCDFYLHVNVPKVFEMQQIFDCYHAKRWKSKTQQDRTQIATRQLYIT